MCVCVCVPKSARTKGAYGGSRFEALNVTVCYESNSFCSYCMLPLVALGLSLFSLVPGPATKLVSSTSYQTCEVIEKSSSLRSKGFVRSARESKAVFLTHCHYF